MGKVLFGLSVSLDGFIADKHDNVSQVFAWMGSTMEHFHEVVGNQLNDCGAVIMGRRSFNQIDTERGWVFPDGTAPSWRSGCASTTPVNISGFSTANRTNLTLCPLETISAKPSTDLGSKPDEAISQHEQSTGQKGMHLQRGPSPWTLSTLSAA